MYIDWGKKIIEYQVRKYASGELSMLCNRVNNVNNENIAFVTK